jgi:hypothetical protein
MKKTLILLAFLVLIPIALGQNYTLTTGQLPTNITMNIEINNLQNNDTIELGSDDWITLENTTYILTENDTNYTFNPILSIPLIEEGNYTKKIYYNATGYTNNEIPIDIEIINNTETYQNFLEEQDKKYLDCIINKIKNNNEENNLTKRLRAEYECRYEVTNNPNGTIAIQKEIQIEEKPIIDEDTKNKINTIETTNTDTNTKIGTLSTDLSNFKTDIMNKIQELEENLTNKQETTTNSEINWTTLIIITAATILILGGLAIYIQRKRTYKQPEIKHTKNDTTKPEEKKTIFKKKDKQEFDRLT